MQKDFEALIGQGEQTQGGSWRLTKEGALCVYGKIKEGRRECEEFFLVLMCARIKHEKNVCRN